MPKEFEDEGVGVSIIRFFTNTHFRHILMMEISSFDKNGIDICFSTFLASVFFSFGRIDSICLLTFMTNNIIWIVVKCHEVVQILIVDAVRVIE